jgi:hypothetical protein
MSTGPFVKANYATMKTILKSLLLLSLLAEGICLAQTANDDGVPATSDIDGKTNNLYLFSQRIFK